MAIPAGTIQKKIFDFVYILSMREAVRQKAYSGDKKWLVKVSCAKGVTKEYIDRILFGEPFSSQEEHDKFFLETTKEICGCINQSKPSESSDFTFGNAQKLINMAVKYFYIIYYYCKNVRVKFVYCHCPMDSQMLQKVWKGYKSKKVSTILDGWKNKDFTASWGKEDFDHDPSGKKIIPKRYTKFQEYIREVCKSKGMIPIEYDYYMWGEGDMEQMLEEEEN